MLSPILRRKLRRFLPLLLCFAILSGIAGIPVSAALTSIPYIDGIEDVGCNTSRTSAYTDDWEYWSQGASKNYNMRAYGCRVVAQAKMLVEMGAAPANTNEFNPDIFLDWAQSFGYWTSAVMETHPLCQASVAYAAQSGITLTKGYASLSGRNSASDAETVMSYIEQGYYVLLDCSSHCAYVGRDASLQEGTAVILDSWANQTSNHESVCYLEGYNFSYFSGFYYFSVYNNAYQETVTRSFAPIYAHFDDSPERTMINTTNAVIGKHLTFDGADLSDVSRVGFFLYDANGVQLAGVGEAPVMGNGYIDVFYNIYSELRVTLQPNTLYRYKFFAVCDGKTYESPIENFMTSPIPVLNVTLDSAGGTLVGESTLKVTQNASYPELPTPSRTGYTFVRWRDDSWSTVSGGMVCSAAADHTLTAVWDKVSLSFADVLENDWYYAPVLWATSSGITSGVSQFSFAPNSTATRAQAVVMLYRAAGSPSVGTSVKNNFRDVADNSYYRDAVLWAVANGITNGTSSDSFSPDEPITREQLLTFLWRYAGSVRLSYEGALYSDVMQGDVFFDAILWATDRGITQGQSDNSFGIGARCSRAEAVTFLYRYFA